MQQSTYEYRHPHPSYSSSRKEGYPQLVLRHGPSTAFEFCGMEGHLDGIAGENRPGDENHHASVSVIPYAPRGYEAGKLLHSPQLLKREG